jgi:D-xylose transport system substrate-binding protein
VSSVRLNGLGGLRSPRAKLIVPVVIVAATALAVAGCGGGGGGGEKKASKVAVLLPDTKSSARWETQDRPLLDKAFKDAGVPHTIVNAQGDPATQRSQLDQALTSGAKTILLVDLDPGSGAAIIRAAKAQGAKVIDYDRLTLGGDADFYVSFDNTEVGRQMGLNLVNGIKQKGLKTPVVAELNGGPEDNNASLLAKGYNGVLDPLYKDGTYKKGPDQSVEKWDNQKALTIFEQFLEKTNNKIDASIAANDGLANAAISALKARKLPNIPITGQDATVQGVQHLLAGEQYVTIYKPIQQEAAAAAKVAIALAKGEKPQTNAQSANKAKQTPSVLLKPIPVTKDNIKDTVIKDGFVKRSELCVGKFASLCQKAGI